VSDVNEKFVVSSLACGGNGRTPETLERDACDRLRIKLMKQLTDAQQKESVTITTTDVT
jgi:hypothetical protein